jgi:DNA adenine methylase
MADSLIPRPFLKWAGGKTQLTDSLLACAPPCFKVYHEPFVGSGALFFRLYREQKIRQAVISDINAELIDTYIAIRDCVFDVIRILSEFPYTREFYYEVRAKDPWELSLPERAARMIYLNKTGYNGLYRVNRQGRFNVPFGRYKSPNYLDRENLLAVSRALQNVQILCTPFETVLERANPNDWVYFDPPYMPVSQTANFTSYSANGFGLSDQKRLRDICIELDRRGVYVTVSNSDTDVIHDLYTPDFVITKVLANRAINCNGAKRGKISELIITNYPVRKVSQLQLFESKNEGFNNQQLLAS